MFAFATGLFVLGAGLMITRAQDPGGEPVQTAVDNPDLPVSEPSWTFFASQREKLAKALQNPQRKSNLTMEVVKNLAPAEAAMAALALPSPPGGSRMDTIQRNSSTGTIDRYIFDALASAGVAP